MNACHVRRCCLAAAIALTAAGVCPTTVLAQRWDAEGFEVLTRGPVHEAFAETISYDPQPGIVVPRPPPDLIDEIPPEERPDAANVAWIPGYWGWDDDRGDYLWISGIWRVVPPGQQWVSGYWLQSSAGWRWVSGYWADAEVEETEYLPQPPQPVEVAPASSPPAPNLVWVPGCWVWHHHRYAWRPGYWAAGRVDWTWVPAHYVWSPRGYVFVEGYWDYDVQRRGVLFAPVYVEQRVYSRRNVVYSPTIAIDLNIFVDHLFVRPRYCHYYFGDYYAAKYEEAGYYAPFSHRFYRYGYDPIYVHKRWEHRRDPEWGRRMEVSFEYRRQHEHARPPHTYVTQRQASHRNRGTSETALTVAKTLTQLVNRKQSPIHFRKVDASEKQSLVDHAREIRRFSGERQKVEVASTPKTADKPGTAPGPRPGATSGDKPATTAEPTRARLPRSPIAARRSAQPATNKEQTPPKPHRVPKEDPNAKPRTAEPAPAPGEKKAEPKPAPPAPPNKKAEPKPVPPAPPEKKPEPKPAEPREKKPEAKPHPKEKDKKSEGKPQTPPEKPKEKKPEAKPPEPAKPKEKHDDKPKEKKPEPKPGKPDSKDKPAGTSPG